MKVGDLELPEQQLRAFCRKWQIVQFAVFGSVLREDFRPDSDIDVMVTFADPRVWQFRDLMKMETELRAIFGRDVDMVERDAVVENPNWVVRRRILETAHVLDVA